MSVEGIQQDPKPNGNGQVETVVGLGQVQQGEQSGIRLCLVASLHTRRGITGSARQVPRTTCAYYFAVRRSLNMFAVTFIESLCYTFGIIHICLHMLISPMSSGSTYERGNPDQQWSLFAYTCISHRNNRTRCFEHVRR